MQFQIAKFETPENALVLQLISQMMNLNPLKRPSIEQVIGALEDINNFIDDKSSAYITPISTTGR